MYIRQVDVTSAFLQADENEDGDEEGKKRTLVRPPKEVYESGACEEGNAWEV